MKVISEIYMHVRPLYMDDWLTTAFVENDSSSEFEVWLLCLLLKMTGWGGLARLTRVVCVSCVCVVCVVCVLCV
jgi:hypothetical protein